jgi:hypothetical protein
MSLPLAILLLEIIVVVLETVVTIAVVKLLFTAIVSAAVVVTAIGPCGWYPNDTLSSVTCRVTVGAVTARARVF